MANFLQNQTGVSKMFYNMTQYNDIEFVIKFDMLYIVTNNINAIRITSYNVCYTKLLRIVTPFTPAIMPMS